MKTLNINLTQPTTPNSFFLESPKAEFGPLEDVRKLAQQTFSHLDLAMPSHEAHTPYYLHFYLGQVAKRIEKADKLSRHSIERNESFMEIIKDLGRNYCVDQAISVVADFIPKDERNYALAALTHTLMKENNIESAYTAASYISESWLREKAIKM